MDANNPDPLDRIRAAAEAELRRPVLKIEPTVGPARTAFRVVFEDRSVIAVRRATGGRTRLEAMVLRAIAPRCDAVPHYLGLRDDTLFHSDPGGNRLAVAVDGADALAAEDLADQAVGAIFAFQIAARDLKTRLPLPPLGVSPDWTRRLVGAVDGLAAFGPGVPQALDRAGLAEALHVKPARFVKWDCRSANAALDDRGVLRWFDFGYCGMRHGCEDFAWLVADETWPVPPETMVAVLRDNYSDHFDEGFDDWLAALSLFTVFHALQRLAMIRAEAKARGWTSTSRIRERGGVGRHPDFAAALCATAAFFAARDRRTAPLVPAIEAAQAHFARLERDAKVA